MMSDDDDDTFSKNLEFKVQSFKITLNITFSCKISYLKGGGGGRYRYHFSNDVVAKGILSLLAACRAHFPF